MRDLEIQFAYKPAMDCRVMCKKAYKMLYGKIREGRNLYEERYFC